MPDSKLSSKIHGLQRQIAELQRHISGPEPQREILAETLDRLSIGVDELANTLEEPDILQAIMENTHAYLAYFDPQFNFVRVNSAYVHGSGHSEQELIGRNHFDLFPNPENQAIFERVRDTGQPVKFHAKPFEFPDQPERGITYWDWTLAPVTNEDGQVEGLVLSLLDVTERERADNALRQALQEARQRQAEILALLEGSRTVLAHSDFETAARSIFDSCKRLIGATAGYVALLTEDGTENEVLFLDSGGAPCTVDPTLPMPARGLREETYRSGKIAYENDFPNSEWTRFLPEGHARLDNVLFAPLVVKGITVGLLGLANKPGGFTENDARIASAFGELAAIALFNSRTLESLQNSEERFRSVAQTAGEAIITIDSRGNIIFWNKAATTIFGYTPDEAIGKPLTFIMPERFHSAHQNGIERVVSTGKSRILGKTVEMVGLRRDNSEFPVELTLSTWKIKEEIFFTGIVKDITERKQAEDEIQSLARFPSENRNPVLRVSRDGTILYANRASTPLLALWARQVGQELPYTWRQLAADAIRSGESHTREVSHEGRTFSLDFAPVEEAGYVNLYGRDVTERKRAEEALRERSNELSMLLEISRNVALTLELEPLLELILDHLKAVVDNDGATISRLEKGVLTPLAHRGPIPSGEVSQLRLSLEKSLIGDQLIFGQEPIIVPDVRDDTPLARDFRQVSGERFETIYGQIHSWMGVPLMIKDRIMGVLALQHYEPDHYYSQRQTDLVLALANQAAVAIENARLYEQAQTFAAMEERQRLARDLHDAVSQTLFSASLSAEVLPRLWERNPIEGRRCLEEVHRLTRSALTEMRTLLLELRPEALIETELSDLLSQLTEAVSNRARLPVTLTADQVGPVPPDLQVALYRISQEALNNVVKHAKASRAEVSLRCAPVPPSGEEERAARGLELHISDDGCGFDAECVPPDSLGLGIMHERAGAVGAELRIESQIGQGTQVVVIWPGTQRGRQ